LVALRFLKSKSDLASQTRNLLFSVETRPISENPYKPIISRFWLSKVLSGILWQAASGP